MQVLPVWGLALPLPAVLLITLSVYMLLLAVGLWVRYCLKDRCSSPGCSSPGCSSPGCSSPCCSCCVGAPLSERCFALAEACDPCLSGAPSCRDSCPPCSCSKCDCTCTWQPPECDSCNCLCFEIRVR